MISKLSIRNFKCLREVQTDLERFTVFVGPNASGKSSILQGMDLLCRSFRDQEGGVNAKLLQEVSKGSKDSMKSPSKPGDKVANGPSPLVPPDVVELAAKCGGKAYRYRTPSISASAPHNIMGGFGTTQGQEWQGEGCGVGPELNSKSWERWSPDHGDQSPLPHSVLLRLEGV
jgi:hypothetical protein